MMWPIKKKPVEQVDPEAAIARTQAERQLAQVRAQGRYVFRLTAALIERRALNHFGDDIQITFTPRGGAHA